MSKRIVPQVAKDLIAARKLIEDERNWWDGRGPSNGRNCLLSAIGALNFDVIETLRTAHGIATQTGVAVFNDSHTHAENLAALDHAISTAIAQANAEAS